MGLGLGLDSTATFSIKPSNGFSSSCPCWGKGTGAGIGSGARLGSVSAVGLTAEYDSASYSHSELLYALKGPCVPLEMYPSLADVGESTSVRHRFSKYAIKSL